MFQTIEIAGHQFPLHCRGKNIQVDFRIFDQPVQFLLESSRIGLGRERGEFFGTFAVNFLRKLGLIFVGPVGLVGCFGRSLYDGGEGRL